MAVGLFCVSYMLCCAKFDSGSDQMVFYVFWPFITASEPFLVDVFCSD